MVLSVKPTNIEARLVDKPDTDSIFVAVSPVWPCYPELSDASWTGPRKGKLTKMLRNPMHLSLSELLVVARSMLRDTHGTV